MNDSTRSGFRHTATFMMCAIGLGLAGCSSSSTPSPTGDAGSNTDAASGADGGGNTSSCSGATPVSLTVKNVLKWCDVTVGTGTPSAALSQTVCVASGTVNLLAAPLSGYELGNAPWHDTSGDKGSGDPGTPAGSGATTVSVTSGSACVWVCCPFTDGSGCPSTNQCP